MKIAIAIPTYNRCDRLMQAIESIENQITDPSIELYCIISNTASVDKTHDFLKRISSKRVNYIIHSSLENSIYINWRTLTGLIPDEIDWVWFLGDDDYLFSSNSVQIVCNAINDSKNDGLAFVHACQARRSRRTGGMIKGDLFSLCNEIGYHEMLGWMSSLVVRRDKFKLALFQATAHSASIRDVNDCMNLELSAYGHSAALLEHCHSDQALFIDIPLVEPQDSEQTSESIQRWALENTIERYFFVIDDLLKLQVKGILRDGLKMNFFRYLSVSFWDRYVHYIYAKIIESKEVSPEMEKYILKLQKISTLFQSPADAKFFIQWYHGIESEINSYISNIQRVKSSKNDMLKKIAVGNIGGYSFEILSSNGNVQ